MLHNTLSNRITLLLSLATLLPIPAASADSFVIRGAQVFDGERALGKIDVWIDGHQIKAVGKNVDAPAGIKIVDGANSTLMPGLFDAHTHTYGEALSDAVIFGVTTELDMFTDPNYARQVKRLEAEGKNLGADLRSAGTLATARGGHGTQYGFAIPTLATPAEAKGWVDARVKEGSDYIKIVYDDCREYGIQRPTLDKETMKALIDATHQAKKLAVVHIGTQQQARDAIEAGADGLAHLFADSAPEPGFAQLAAKHHVFVVPTLCVLEGVSGHASGESLAADAHIEPYLTSANLQNLSKRFPQFNMPLNEQWAEQTTKQLAAAGVPVLAGTDAPNPGTAHGASMHRELELLVRAGLTPAEALTSATSAPAKAFRLADRGRIAPGKRADLLLVKGDPTRDIKATRDIVAVWKAGRPVDRATYCSTIEKARAIAKSAADSAIKGPRLISDFEDNKPAAKFGAGWIVSTDTIAGGKSAGNMKTIAGGSNGSKFALKVTGKIDGGLPYAWAGVMFSPGEHTFAPANLSATKTLTFWTKGDGKTCRAMLFTESGGQIPAVTTFKTGAEWKKHSIPLSTFNGTDGHDISAILFVGGPTPGDFEFQLDDIILE